MNSVLFQRESALTTSTFRGHNRKLRKPAQESKGDKKRGTFYFVGVRRSSKKSRMSPFLFPWIGDANNDSAMTSSDINAMELHLAGNGGYGT